jgi:hypothetical protein
MPVVGVNRDRLFQALGRTYSKCLDWSRVPAAAQPSTACSPLPESHFAQPTRSLMPYASSTALSWTMW